MEWVVTNPRHARSPFNTSELSKACANQLHSTYQALQCRVSPIRWYVQGPCGSASSTQQLPQAPSLLLLLLLLLLLILAPCCVAAGCWRASTFDCVICVTAAYRCY
jgi:hypothetical protein